MAFECLSSFVIGFTSTIDASISLVSVSTRQVPNEFEWRWTVSFIYMRGYPLATAFRLETTSGLSGRFFPPKPIGTNPLFVQTATLEGTVAIPEDIYNDPTFTGITFDGTVIIVQA